MDNAIKRATVSNEDDIMMVILISANLSEQLLSPAEGQADIALDKARQLLVQVSRTLGTR